jgi:hypothetical protein
MASMDTADHPDDPSIEELQRSLVDADPVEAPEIAETIARRLGERLDPGTGDEPEPTS